jgi:hypothetical protein
MTPLLEPFAEIPVHPDVAALPKADIHIHQEWCPAWIGYWHGRGGANRITGASGQ